MLDNAALDPDFVRAMLHLMPSYGMAPLETLALEVPAHVAGGQIFTRDINHLTPGDQFLSAEHLLSELWKQFGKSSDPATQAKLQNAVKMLDDFIRGVSDEVTKPITPEDRINLAQHYDDALEAAGIDTAPFQKMTDAGTRKAIRAKKGTGTTANGHRTSTYSSGTSGGNASGGGISPLRPDRRGNQELYPEGRQAGEGGTDVLQGRPAQALLPRSGSEGIERSHTSPYEEYGADKRDNVLPAWADAEVGGRGLDPLDLDFQRKEGEKRGLPKEAFSSDPVAVNKEEVVPASVGADPAETYEAIDDLLKKYPDPLASRDQWAAFMAHVFGQSNPLVAPRQGVLDVNNPEQLAEAFKRMQENTRQWELTVSGLRAAQAMGKLWLDGTAQPVHTALLFFWGALSKRKSPYPHEAGFLDAVANGLLRHLAKIVDGTWNEGLQYELFDPDKNSVGRFDSKDAAELKREEHKSDVVENGGVIKGKYTIIPTSPAIREYLEWAKTAIPEGSPGRPVIDNINEFATTTAMKFAEYDPVTGRTKLDLLHEAWASKMSGQEVRRRFHEIFEGKGVGVDNKVTSFLLLVTGRSALVFDRVQFNRMLGDGSVNLYNLGLSAYGDGVRGMALYEGLENALRDPVYQAARKAGITRDNTPSGGTLGMYHWATWVYKSAQEAGHSSIDAIRRLIEGMTPAQALEGAGVGEGRYDDHNYKTYYIYGENGVPMLGVTTEDGVPYQFTADEWKQLKAALNEQKKPGSVIPDEERAVQSGFKISKQTRENGRDRPWWEEPGNSRAGYDALIRKYGKPAIGKNAAYIKHYANGTGHGGEEQGGLRESADLERGYATLEGIQGAGSDTAGDAANLPKPDAPRPGVAGAGGRAVRHGLDRAEAFSDEPAQTVQEFFKGLSDGLDSLDIEMSRKSGDDALRGDDEEQLPTSEERRSIVKAGITLWRAGLVSSPRTVAKIALSQAGLGTLEEIARIPASLADIAITAVRRGERQVQGFSPMSIVAASREAATKGVSQGLRILGGKELTEDEKRLPVALPHNGTDRAISRNGHKRRFKTSATKSRTASRSAFSKPLTPRRRQILLRGVNLSGRFRQKNDAQALDSPLIPCYNSFRCRDVMPPGRVVKWQTRWS